jgi:LmbE family N-acetylglucosaminyl deacetylase
LNNDSLTALFETTLSIRSATIVLLGPIEVSKHARRSARARIIRIKKPKAHTPSKLLDPVGLPGDLDLPDGCADIVASIDWHEHSPWYRWSLQEVGRILKIGGVAILCLSVVDEKAISIAAESGNKMMLPFFLRKTLFGVGVRRYAAPKDILEELGFKIQKLDLVRTRRRINLLNFRSGSLVGSVQNIGQDGVMSVFCSKVDSTFPANPKLSDREALEAFLDRDYRSERLALMQVAKSAGLPIRANPLSIALPGKRALVLSPHPDDELIGVGGTLLSLSSLGGALTILQMSNGANAAALEGLPLALREYVRLAEARRVAKALNAKLICWNDVFDGAGIDAKQLAARLASVLREADPDMVFVPFWADPHPDHRNANCLLIEALQDWDPRKSFQVISYEVWSFLPFNTAIDISRWSRRKFELLLEYRTALRCINYARTTQWFAAWRSYEAFGRAGQVEVFLSLAASEYKQLASKQLKIA